MRYNKPADKNAWGSAAGCKFSTGSGIKFFDKTSTKIKQGAITFQHSLSDTSAAVESPEVYMDQVTEEISDLTISTSSSAGLGRGNVTWKFTAKAASAEQVNGFDQTLAAVSRKILEGISLKAGNVIFEAPIECYMYQGTAAAKNNEVHYTESTGGGSIAFHAPKFQAGEVVITCNNARNPVSAEVNTTFGYVDYSVYSAVQGDTVCKSTTTAADSGLTKAGTNTNKIYIHQSKYKGYAPLGAVAEADFDGACSVGAGVLGSFLVVAASLMCA